jgi:hypothetical protein
MDEADSLLAVLSILSDANTASHFNASGLIQALDAWLQQQQVTLPFCTASKLTLHLDW